MDGVLDIEPKRLPWKSVKGFCGALGMCGRTGNPDRGRRHIYIKPGKGLLFSVGSDLKGKTGCVGVLSGSFLATTGFQATQKNIRRFALR